MTARYARRRIPVCAKKGRESESAHMLTFLFGIPGEPRSLRVSSYPRFERHGIRSDGSCQRYRRNRIDGPERLAVQVTSTSRASVRSASSVPTAFGGRGISRPSAFAALSPILRQQGVTIRHRNGAYRVRTSRRTQLIKVLFGRYPA